MAVEVLYNKLHSLLMEEILSLNIGYPYNISGLNKMSMIVHALDYIDQARPSNDELLEILNHYEEI